MWLLLWFADSTPLWIWQNAGHTDADAHPLLPLRMRVQVRQKCPLSSFYMPSFTFMASFLLSLLLTTWVCKEDKNPFAPFPCHFPPISSASYTIIFIIDLLLLFFIYFILHFSYTYIYTHHSYPLTPTHLNKGSIFHHIVGTVPFCAPRSSYKYPPNFGHWVPS